MSELAQPPALAAEPGHKSPFEVTFPLSYGGAVIAPSCPGTASHEPTVPRSRCWEPSVMGWPGSQGHPCAVAPARREQTGIVPWGWARAAPHGQRAPCSLDVTHPGHLPGDRGAAGQALSSGTGPGGAGGCECSPGPVWAQGQLSCARLWLLLARPPSPLHSSLPAGNWLFPQPHISAPLAIQGTALSPAGEPRCCQLPGILRPCRNMLPRARAATWLSSCCVSWHLLEPTARSATAGCRLCNSGTGVTEAASPQHQGAQTPGRLQPHCRKPGEMRKGDCGGDLVG